MTNNKIMVSVLCTAYNHEKYIRKCLDGFVMQQTNFKYEVIINDDASTDRTADIIREYEEKYPEIIKPIYQTENQYSIDRNVTANILLPRVKGKYIALCEGDDFWTDPLKLQMQFDAMEQHPECVICLHKVQMISEDEKNICGYKPEINIKTGIIKQDDFARILVNTRTSRFMQFQLTSYFLRTSTEKKYREEAKCFYSQFDVGDLPRLLYCSTQGDAYYLNDNMSNYRVGSIGSWNFRNKDINKRVEHLDTQINGLRAFNELTNDKYSKDVEVGINSHQLEKALIKESLTPQLYKEYKQAVQYYPFRSKVRIFASAYCPSLLKLYYKVTGQN